MVPGQFHLSSEDYTVDMVTMLMLLPGMVSQPRIELQSYLVVHLLRVPKMRWV